MVSAPTGVAEPEVETARPAQFLEGDAPSADERRSSHAWIVVVAVLVVAAVAAVAAVAIHSRHHENASPPALASSQNAGTGQGWSAQWSVTNYDLRTVSFADATHGWAVGGSMDGGIGVILATTDGGNTWSVQDAGGGFETLNAVWCTDALHCYAVGQDGTVLATSDGGQTWSAQRPAENSALNDITFADAQHGWCTGVSTTDNGLNYVLVTSDGGQSWTAREFHEMHAFLGISFVDDQHGWLAKSEYPSETGPPGGYVLKTSDAGVTWQTAFHIVGSLTDVFFVDSSHGWAIGSDANGNGALYATTDAGQTWAQQPLGGSSVPTAMYFADAEHGWAVSDGVYYTDDGGASWTQQLLGDGTTLFGIAFAGDTSGYVVGSGGVVLQTADAGVGDGSPQSLSSMTGSQADANSSDAMKAYVQRLEQLLIQSGRGRQSLGDALAGYGNGSLTRGQAAAAMKAVINNRASVLNQVRGLSVPSDPAAQQCRVALMRAMKSSLGADRRYMLWVQGSGTEAAADPFNKSAGKWKGQFAKEFNALAAQYGLRHNWQVSDL